MPPTRTTGRDAPGPPVTTQTRPADPRDARTSTLAQVRARGPLRGRLALLGPAFVAAVAYVDPGNFATNFSAGARHGYQLVWVIVMANVMAMLVQYLSSKLGLATGASLPALCGRRLSRLTNLALWVQAELVAMATDLAEFVGAALGLHLVFGVPLLPAGLITAVAAFAVHALEQRGYRRFELAIIAMLMVVAGGFGYMYLAVGQQQYPSMAAGLVPSLPGPDGLGLAVGIVGATVMPHAVYLHSQLQTNRVAAQSPQDRQRLLRYNRWDCIIGLGAAGLVNLAMLCIAAGLVQGSGPAALADLVGIQSSLAGQLGGGAALVFGVALMASGFSSAGVGTYAGQVVMAGFMNWRIPMFARRALTMLPSLVVLAFATDTTQALVFSQIVLSFGIPFALVPLLMLTARPELMRDMANRMRTNVAMVVVTVTISALNAYLLWEAFAG
jgi:manganese transport protein